MLSGAGRDHWVERMSIDEQALVAADGSDVRIQ
jgi:hypothetical protein